MTKPKTRAETDADFAKRMAAKGYRRRWVWLKDSQGSTVRAFARDDKAVREYKEKAKCR